MAPAPERSTPISVCVDSGGGGTAGLHPRIVPASVAKMNREEPELVPSLTTNPEPPLNTNPVGPPATLTTSGTALPDPSYSVETSVSLSATHHGVVGPATSPHALTRWASVLAASPGWSETSFVTW